METFPTSLLAVGKNKENRRIVCTLHFVNFITRKYSTIKRDVKILRAANVA